MGSLNPYLKINYSIVLLIPTFLIYDNTTLAHSKLILIPLLIIIEISYSYWNFPNLINGGGFLERFGRWKIFSKSDKWGMLIMHRYILMWKFEDFCIKFLQKCLPIKGVIVNGHFLWLQRSMNKMIISTVTLTLI